MKWNSKLTGGLAWAGLILVLAVPSADMLTKASSNAAATMTSDMDAVVAPAAVETAASGPRVILARPGEEPVVVKTASEDPVEQYLGSGKKLPSYISDAPAEVASKEPAPVTQLVVPKKTNAAGAAEPVEVAAVGNSAPAVNASLTAPVPYPASKRPKAPAVTTATIPPASSEEAPLIVDEELVARREAAVAAVLGDDPLDRRSPGIVRGEELEEWDSGSLADYLERRGLMSRSSNEASRDDFDEDGFFLDEGPNNNEERLRRRLRRDFIFF